MDTSAVSSNLAFEQGISDFSFSLYDAVGKDGNEFISPFSISAALLLLMLGTDGTTKNQMVSSIFKNNIPTNVHQSYMVLHDKLIKSTQTNVTVSIANRVFGSQIFSLLQTYKTDAIRYYGSETELMNFGKNPEQARTRINNWIAKQTRNKIQNVIPKGFLGPSTVAVLANAIYFKGTWKTPFKPSETRKRNFFVGQNIQKQVDMMYGKFAAQAGENTELDCKVLQLPYEGDKISMVFLLPNNMNGLSQLETKLNHDTFNKLLKTLRSQETVIRIPKFTIRADYDLKPILSQLGITEIFDNVVANFSKMISSSAKRFYVSGARHTTFVKVDEEGSEAAAVTVITVGITSVQIHVPFQFVADHPFIFLIRDNVTGTIMFIGRFTGS